MNQQKLDEDWLLYGTIIRLRQADGTVKRVDPTKVYYEADRMIIPAEALEDD